MPHIILNVMLVLLAMCFALGCNQRTGKPLDPQRPHGQSNVNATFPASSSPTSESEATARPGQDRTDSDPLKLVNAIPYFEQLGADSGLNFLRDDDISGQRRIFESTGGGVAAFDIDNDGWLDLLFTGGCKLPMASGPQAATCALFRNAGSARFIDATRGSRLQQPGYCQGVTVGDIDNDGFNDVYISAFGENALWHNRGDGTFADITEAAGVSLASWSTGCAFADINVDGCLDLYVVTYLNESAEAPLQCPNPRAPNGLEQCPPSKFDGLPDALFLSDGQGGFVDVTTSSGLSELRGKGLGVAIVDFNGDARPEIYVANDGEANFLFTSHQRAGGTLALEEFAMTAGAALSHDGYAQASMGIAAGDFDGDGRIDLCLTNFYGDSSTLYRNLGMLQFEDVTRSTGLSGPTRSTLGWGTLFVDLNNDNRLDLFAANGHVEDRRWAGQGEPYKMPAQVFTNLGAGKFAESTQHAGTYFEQEWLGRGIAHGDFDRDGRIDMAISHQLDRSTVLLNRTSPVEPLVTLKLVGTRSNRGAIGARVELLDRAGNAIAVRELSGGTSFQSAPAYEIYLSAPALRAAETMLIAWPSGVRQTMPAPQESKTIIETMATH